MTEKRYELIKDYDCDGNWEYAYQNNETGRRYNFADENCDYDFLNDVNGSYEKLVKENEQLKSDNDYALKLLKRTIDELKYFIGLFKEDEIDITVHTLLKNVNLFLGATEDNYTGYIDYIIEENEQLKKENQGIQDKVMRLLDYVEVKQCVTRTEIKKWWNGDVE